MHRSLSWWTREYLRGTVTSMFLPNTPSARPTISWFVLLSQIAGRKPRSFTFCLRSGAVNVKGWCSKADPHYRLRLPPDDTPTIRLRLHAEGEEPARLPTKAFDAAFATRIKEDDEFYDAILPHVMAAAERNVALQD